MGPQPATTAPPQVQQENAAPPPDPGRGFVSSPLQQETASLSSRRRRGLVRRIRDYVKLAWLDLFFVLLTYIISGALLLWFPLYRLNDRGIPLWYDPLLRRWYSEVSLSCVKGPSVFNSTYTALVVTFVPLGIIFIIGCFTKSFWDSHHAKIGLVKALAVMTLFQEIFKRFVGEYRPYFMSVCKLNYVFLDTQTGSPYSPLWFRVGDVCIPPIYINSMQSFPSGHTGSAFAVGVFMALWLNAKLKAYSDYHTSFWKQLAVLAPLFGALLIGCGVWIDCSHHAHDIILSILVGTLCALLSYRAHFHSLFDYRNNHIPLPYHGNTESFKPTDSTFNIPSRALEKEKGNDEAANGVNNPVPHRHLAVRWPFSSDEKRGSGSTRRSPGPVPAATKGSAATSIRSRTSGESVESPVGSEVAEMV